MKLDVSPAFFIEKMAKICTEKTDMNCQFFESSEDVPDPRDLNRGKKNLMIFDDLQLEKQTSANRITSEEDIVT